MGLSAILAQSPTAPDQDEFRSHAQRAGLEQKRPALGGCGIVTRALFSSEN